MRRFALLMLALALPIWAVAQSKHGEFEVKNVKTNGTLKFDLSAGDYEIVGSDHESVRITYDSEPRDGSIGITADTDTDGPRTSVRIWRTPHNFHARIEIPKKQNLLIQLTAGNIQITSVQGSKDLGINTGNVDIAVGDPQQYGHVEAKVLAGNIEASPFRVNKGGLWRSFQLKGAGDYSLSVHLLAGNIRFY